MSICKTCGAECPDQAAFCTQCGTPMANESNPETPVAPVYETPVAPVYEAPVAPVYEAPAAPVYEAPAAPTYEAPAYAYAPPVSESGSKAPAILGMIFGISAIILSFILMVGIISAIDTYSYYYDHYDYYYSITDELMGVILGFSIFLLPCLIVGLVMSFKAKVGKGMAIAGKITNFIALGMYTISFIMALSA